MCGVDNLSGEQIILTLIERIGKTGELMDVAYAYDAAMARKCCSLAYLTPDIAIFHARMQHMKSLRIAFAANSSGFECCWLPDAPQRLKLLVLVLTPLDEPSGYLRTLSGLTRLCQKQDFLEHVCRLVDPQQFWEYVNETDEQLSDYVSAGDIMQTTFHSLRDTDALSAAIDAFCRLGVSELPVLDADGDLVGVVSDDELIRICLPDYITWMEDLSPILDFQPFAEILRQEEGMPVVEIMMLAERYATVEETAPAVQVAKLMMRRDVRQVWVLRDDRLVGVISIQDFIRKVLRA